MERKEIEEKVRGILIDDLEDLVRDLFVNGSLCEEVFSSQEFRSLSEYDRGSQINQLVRNIADHTVGCHSACGIGSAALDGHHDLGDVCRLTL